MYLCTIGNAAMVIVWRAMDNFISGLAWPVTVLTNFHRSQCMTSRFLKCSRKCCWKLSGSANELSMCCPRSSNNDVSLNTSSQNPNFSKSHRRNCRYNTLVVV